MSPPLSIGLFGRFGRSASLRAFDMALRDVDLHPNLVPEAVKLTAVKMLIEETGREDPGSDSMHATAEIIAYCLIGADAFSGANGEIAKADTEQRIDAALVSGTSLDARLVLLTLQAGIIQPSVVNHFALEAAFN